MIEPGDIILIKGSRPVISRIIRWFTGSEYTHVGMAVSASHIYEIDIDKKLGIHEFNEVSYDVFRYKNGLTDEQKFMMKNHAIQQALLNRGYDWLRIVSFGLEKIFKTKKTFDWANKVVCSEIIDNLYMYAGIDLVPKRHNGDVTPAHLAASTELIQVFSSQELHI
jgi:hypothetical protein